MLCSHYVQSNYFSFLGWLLKYCFENIFNLIRYILLFSVPLWRGVSRTSLELCCFLQFCWAEVWKQGSTRQGRRVLSTPAAAALLYPQQCQSPGEPGWGLRDRIRHMCEQEMAWSQHQLLLTVSLLSRPKQQEQQVWLLVCLPPAGAAQAWSMGSKIQFCLHDWRPLAGLMWQLLPALVLIWAEEGGVLQVLLNDYILCSTTTFKRDLARMCTRLESLVLTLSLKYAVPPV